MINYETILSAYNDKVTLVKWLKKVEEALLNDTLQSIEIDQPTADTAIFTFIFGSGDTLQSPTLNLPQGATGAKGDDGVSVVNAEIDASNHLILTLSNGSLIDCGEIASNEVVKQRIVQATYLFPVLTSSTTIQNPNSEYIGDVLRCNDVYTNNSGVLYAQAFYQNGQKVQDKLESGTSIKTINNESLLGSGNISIMAEPELYKCTYGTTTYAQITQAVSDGKIPYVMSGGKSYFYTSTASSRHYFFIISATSTYGVYVNSSNSWIDIVYPLQTISNKTTSITASSTDTQYPSAKATYDFGKGLLTPSANASTTILNHEAVFTFGSDVFNASNNKWLAIFTFGNTFTMIPLYTLSQGVTYKTAGTFVYDGNGSVVSTTINYEITGDNAIVFSSGNSNFDFEEDYMAYLFLLKLY